MTIHFAPARRAATSPVARILARGPIALAVNDNGDVQPLIDGMTEAALRHFAVHGLGSACAALLQAGAARAAGDTQGEASWVGICAMFDRQAAEAFKRALDD